MKNASTGATRPSFVLVAEDHPQMREGVVQLVESQEDMVVCGVADSVDSIWDVAEAMLPDVVLLDLRLGEDDTLGFIGELKEMDPDLPVLVYSQFEETLFAERALRVGAWGYVMKQADPEEVLEAIRAVLRGEKYVSPAMSVHLALKEPELLVPDADSGPMESFTPREFNVFQWLGGGSRVEQIAEHLQVSREEVEGHQEAIRQKLGLADGAQLRACAEEWMREVFIEPLEAGPKP